MIAPLLLTLLVATAPAAAVSPASAPLPDELAILRAYFDDHPELVGQPGTGWKQYERFRWFVERRMVGGRLPSPADRLRAWDTKRRVEGRGAGNAWFAIGPLNFSGLVRDLAFHPANPNVAWACAAGGGIWRTTDGGASWTPLGDDQATLGAGAVAVLPSNPNVILYGTGQPGPGDGAGMLRSTDAGDTWHATSLVSALTDYHYIEVIEVNPITGTVLAGANDGLYRSTDGGAMWTLVSSGRYFNDVKWKPGDASRVYAAKGRDLVLGNNEIRVSTDDGLTWAKAGTGQPPSASIGRTKLAVSADAPSTVYAIITTVSNGALLGLFRSTDDGATWHQRPAENLVMLNGWFNLSFVADPEDADRLHLGAIVLYRSTDAGASWASNIAGGMVHVDEHVLAYEPGSSTNLWVGTDGGFWRSTDDGLTWAPRNTNLVTYQFYDVCVAQTDPDLTFGGSQDQGTDGRPSGTTWFDALGGDGMVCNIDPTNASVIYAELQLGAHRKSTQGGLLGTFTTIMNGLTGSGAWVAPVALDPNLPERLFTATSAGTFRSIGGAALWTNVSAHEPIWISIHPVDGDIVWTVDETSARVSTDGGDTWSATAAFGLAVGDATKIHADPTNTAAAIVTFSGWEGGLAHVAHTTNFGATWPCRRSRSALRTSRPRRRT